jgi:hypothetical protein
MTRMRTGQRLSKATLAAYTVLWAKENHQIWDHLELAL